MKKGGSSIFLFHADVYLNTKNEQGIRFVQIPANCCILVRPQNTVEHCIVADQGEADRRSHQSLSFRNIVRIVIAIWKVILCNYKLGLHQISGPPDIRPFLYPVSGRISGFVCRISGWTDSRISGQKNFTWYILSSKPRSPLNITIKCRKL